MVMRDDAYVTPETLTRATAAWLRRVREATYPRPHLSVCPDKCALLVIDMLHYFAAPEGRCYLPAASAVIPNIAALLECWRTHSWPVLFTRHCHTGEGDLGMLGKFFSDYIHAGTEDADIIPALQPRDDELSLEKTTYDAFLNTPLEEELRTRGVQQVLITGVLTHMCCETTARSAFCRGFEVYVAADGTASTTEERHLQSLLGMAEAVAVVLSTEEIQSGC